MKNFILVLICILMVVIFAGCSLNKQILAHESNADMISKTVKGIVSVVAEKKKDSKQIKMSVVDPNAMPSGYPNHSVNVLVQDAVISALVSSGFTVLERDINLLDRVSLENGEKANTSIKTSFENTAKPEVKREDSFSSSISKTADVVLGYRLLECGIEYSKGSTPELIRRSAKVKINFRLIGKDSIVSWSEIQEKEISDEIEPEAISDVENSSLRFYGYSMPGLRENNSSGQPSVLTGIKDNRAGTKAGTRAPAGDFGF